MASEPVDADELDSIERRRWGDDSKVYTRRSKGKRNTNNNGGAAPTPVAKEIENPKFSISDSKELSSQTLPDPDGNSLQPKNPSEPPLPPPTIPPPSTLTDQDRNSLQQEKPSEPPIPPPSTLADHDRESSQPEKPSEPLLPPPSTLTDQDREKPSETLLPPPPDEQQKNGINRETETQGASISQVLPENRVVVVPPQPSGNEAVTEPELELRPTLITRVNDKIRINIPGAISINEINELRIKLEGEVDQVRTLYKKVEGKELHLTSFSIQGHGVHGHGHGHVHAPQYEVMDRRRVLTRVNSEVGPTRSLNPFNRSLSVSMVENDRGIIDREKRTPKANQFYRNSEFLLGKDRLPPESNKKLKLNNNNGGSRKHTEVPRGSGFNFDKHKEKVFRSCSNLLQKLMKHNHGWVFNEPVDANKLNLLDYHDVIKNPMDLGSIRTRLVRNYYKSPREFAEDVRLVFNNAMTYNPPGQDVHVMAETLLKIFEERWAVIEVEYNPDWRHQMYHNAGLPVPGHGPGPGPAPASFAPANYAPASNIAAPASYIAPRVPALKKPKARDLNKRNMTYDEKQKLGAKLQNLPAEKLDNIVQIINKRNSSLSQNGDEIEIDIDIVDTETLWELDRFVTNYKKNLSKNKRKAEVALQVPTPMYTTIPVTNPVPVIAPAPAPVNIAPTPATSVPAPASLAGETNAPVTGTGNGGENAATKSSSSSSSSSSDSGSSSSDSDSDSSSSDSDAEPKT